jgi:hypothetical protein
MSSSSKKKSVGHKNTSFLIEDILTTKSPVTANQFNSLSEHTLNTMASLISDTNPVPGRRFTAAALLGSTQTSTIQGPGSLMASSTAALQRHLQVAAFYAPTSATTHQTLPTLFDRSVFGPSTADISAAHLFPDNDNLPGKL